ASTREAEAEPRRLALVEQEAQHAAVHRVTLVPEALGRRHERRATHGLDDALGRGGDDRPVEVLFVGEVVVHRPLGQPRPLDDAVEARALEAGRAELDGGRLEDGLASVFVESLESGQGHLVLLGRSTWLDHVVSFLYGPLLEVK